MAEAAQDKGQTKQAAALVRRRPVMAAGGGGVLLDDGVLPVHLKVGELLPHP